MRTSKAGVDLIASFEGFPNGGRPYNDPVGFATVGYGHLLGRRPVNASDARGVWLNGQRRPGVLTQAEAKVLLGRDLRHREKAVRRLVQVPLTQAQFDALVSFTYNVGEGALAGSTLLRRLNAGDYRGAADALLAWDKAGSPPRPLPGLTRRRRAERTMFLQGRSGDTAEGDRAQFRGFTESEIRWITEYDRLRRTDRKPRRRQELERLMTERRKRIWRLAQPDGDGGGWEHRNRRERYRALLARTRTARRATSRVG